MQYWRRLSIVIIGFIESLMFSGCLFGWPSLMHVLQQEGVYSHLCLHANDSVLPTTSSFTFLPEFTTAFPMIQPFKPTTSHYSQKNDNIKEQNTFIMNSDSSIEITTDPNLTHENENRDFLIYRKRRSSGISDENLQADTDIMSNVLISSNEEEVEKAVEDIQRMKDAPHHKPCKDQSVQMTKIYTVAAVSYGLTSILIGFSLDILGLWFTRIGGCVMTSGGFFVLAFTSQDSSWLLWPALILIALGTSQLRLSSFQFANLWPEYRTTILILYSSAYSVSTTLFLVIQIAYVGNISYQTIGLALAVISLLTFPPTLIMPRMKIEPEENDAKTDKISNNENPTNNDDTDVPRILRNKDDDSKLMNPFDEGGSEDARQKKKQVSNEVVPLKISLCTLSAILHLFWHFISFFLVLFYSATFMPWIQMTTEDPKMIEHYNKISGVCALIAPMFIPIAGLVTDWQIRNAAKHEDRVERLALTMQAPALTKAIASLFVLATMICKIFFSPEAIYASMILIAVSRPFIVGSCASYIQIRFHPSHFNRLNGIFTTIVSIMSLLQFPIIIWMKQSANDFVNAQLMLIGLLVLAFSSPGHILIKPLARKYARAQLKFRDI